MVLAKTTLGLTAGTPEREERTPRGGRADGDGGRHGSAGRSLASHARPGRSSAPRARRRDRPPAGSPRRWLAKPPGHGPGGHQLVQGGHRGPCQIRRGPGRRAGGPGYRAVRHLGRRSGYLRATQAGDRLASPSVRGGPSRPPGVEAPTSGRAGLRCPRVAAVGAGRLRGGRILVGPGGRRRLRSRPAGGRRLHRCHHVSHQRRQRGHPAPNGWARPGLDLRHDLPLADRTPRGGASARFRGSREGCASIRDSLSSASTHPTTCSRWRATPDFETPSTCRRTLFNERYFAGRTDGLRTSRGEELLVATT